MPTTQIQEHRATQRHDLECPLEFRGGQGLSRNISSAGILFSTLEPFKPRQRFAFTLLPYHAPPVHCLAEVVRTVALDDHFDVAASFTLLAVDEPGAASS